MTHFGQGAGFRRGRLEIATATKAWFLNNKKGRLKISKERLDKQ